jgi:hypothetical protein
MPLGTGYTGRYLRTDPKGTKQAASRTLSFGFVKILDSGRYGIFLIMLGILRHDPLIR